MPRGLLRRLLAVSLSSALAAGGLAVGVGAADADPRPSMVRTASGLAGPDPAAERAAVEARSDVVLIARTRTTGQVAAVSAAAAKEGLTVAHRFASLKALSVRVARSEVGGATATLLAQTGVASVKRAVYRYASSLPVNDEDYGYQAGYLGSIDAPSAWALQHGSSSVKIAIIDTGVDITNPDLQHKIASTYDAHTGGTDVQDEIGHGTFVAGVAAAETGNTIGVAGAGYDSDILAVKVADSDGTMSVDDEVAGIRWAVANGAKVLNISLGSTEADPTEKAAVEAAIGAGVVVVAAAGNDTTSTKSYPAAYPGVIAVGATDGSSRAAFSNYGSWVSVAAPGVDIFSTTPAAGSTDFGAAEYGSGDGTSFSSPLVAGEAALLAAQNPSASGAEIRAAIVDSAHGFSGSQLGAGRVDFAAALADLAPTTKPSAVSVAGPSGTTMLLASSGASLVQFAVDGTAVGAPVAVSNGTATRAWSSWGAMNGAHTVTAVDCAANGVCNPVSSSTRSSTSSFSIENAAPTVSVSSSVTGRFTVSADSAGGGLRFSVDGASRDFDGASPYDYSLSASALKDGTHTVRVQQCAANGSICAGPYSPTVTFSSTALHPLLGAVSHRYFSPNGDGVKDTTTISWTLPDTESVQLAFMKPDGTTVRTVDLGSQTRGKHSWTWRGTLENGSTAPDGTYLPTLLTSRTVSGAVVRGSVDTTVAVDTSRPKLTQITAGGSTFYPAKDGFKDTFAPGTKSSQPAKLTLTVRSASKKTVRTITKDIESDRTSIPWSGRTAGGTRVPPGTYAWRFTATDAAGNVRRTAWKTVRVSDKQLVTKTATLSKNGSSTSSATGSDTCATTSTASSRYAHGRLLRNTCSPGEDGTQIAVANYTFAVPKATTYLRASVSTNGYVTHVPTDIGSIFRRVDTSAYVVPDVVLLDSTGTKTVSLGSTSAVHLTTSGHRLTLGIVVANAFVDEAGASGVEDFDIKTVTLKLSYRVLR